MNIITVIPLTRSKVGENLSYFTASKVPVGAMVSVPLRSKSIHAVVTDCQPAENLKADIRKAPFEIRKLGSVRAIRFFPISFMTSCRILAEYYATHIGNILNVLISDTLLEQIQKIAPPVQKTDTNETISPSIKTSETYAVQGDDDDRLGSWRSMIRQEFARKKSVAIHAPTVSDARHLFKALEKGIEGYIFLLHGGMTPKNIVTTWQAIAKNPHPIVMVASGAFAISPRMDIDTVIIERENARGWIQERAPYIDIRHGLETIARRLCQKVYLADSLLRVETLARLDAREITESSPFKWRSISAAKDRLVNMRMPSADLKQDEKVDQKTSPHFKILSPELEELIKHNQEESTHLFIMTIRRGIATITICDDCQKIVICTQCSAPVVLHTSPETGRNFFMCHKCGIRRSADETCKYCDSWRLTPLGIGIDRVYADIRERFPDIDIIKIDIETTKNDKAVYEKLERFRSKPGSILLGTELALSRLSEKVEHVAVVSLDSLFALPDFRIQEKIMYTIIRLRSLAIRSVLVQTRRSEEAVFEYGLKGNLSDFYRFTLEDRKKFSYPPFATLIKITLQGKKDIIAKEMSAIKTLVEPYELDIFPAFTSTVRGLSIIHGLIKLPPLIWPNTDLLAKLRSLPPGARVKINPESLL